MEPQRDILIRVLNKMFGREVLKASSRTEPLQGGTLGDVRLVTGLADMSSGKDLPYKVVWKTQVKWARPGDPDSWRREYDLYHSTLEDAFSSALRRPRLYASEQHDDRIELWIEYIAGVTGNDLTLDMLEVAALELGRFQGKIAQNVDHFKPINDLGDRGFLEREFNQWHTQSLTYDFLVSEASRLPIFLKEKLRNGEIHLIDGKSFEYSCLRSAACGIPDPIKQMIMDIDDRKDELFAGFTKLPAVLCHRDFWIENIFYVDGEIRLIDWDTAGWGFLGEDIASLIVDEVPADQIKENVRRLVPAYLKGLSAGLDASALDERCILEMILLKFGYRMLQEQIFTEGKEGVSWGIQALQEIYELYH